MRFLKIPLIALAALLALAAIAQAGEVKELSLEGAVSLALQNNNTIKSSEAEVEEADYLRKATAARFGPIFQADARVLQWNEAYALGIEDVVELPASAKGLLDLAIGPIAPVELRAEKTVEYSVTAIQPITPLYSVYEGYRARAAGQRALTSMAERTRQDVAFKTVEAYYRVVAVEKLREVAKAAVDTIQAHVEQAQAFEAAEFIGRAEMLTAEVELANAQENLLKAENGVSLARSALAQIVGLPLNVELRLTDDVRNLPTAMPSTLADEQDLAMTHRGDLAAVRSKTEAMAALNRLAWWQLTPTVAALGRWQHTEGIILYEEEEMFVGVTLQWNFWEWGKTYHEARAAGAKLRQAQHFEREATELIRLQVKQKHLELQNAIKRAETAKKAVALSEENLRLQQMRFQENMAASIAVTDAQTLLTRAQTNLINAQCDVLTNLAALRLATGERPDRAGAADQSDQSDKSDPSANPSPGEPAGATP